jgi:hypothetical protein
MLKSIVALVLLAHGIGHIMGFLAAWTPIPVGFTNSTWLFGGATISGTVGKLFGLVWLVALAGFVAAGIGLLADRDWWQMAAVVSAVVSLAVILPWWNTVTPGSRFGAAAVDLAALVVIVLGWGDKIK